jgi:hypothetical protein
MKAILVLSNKPGEPFATDLPFSTVPLSGDDAMDAAFVEKQRWQNPCRAHL